MPDKLLASTPTAGHRLLGVHGQSVIDAHRQLTAVLKLRLGADHAAYFARPELNQRTGSIDWYAASEGSQRPWSGITPEEKAPLAARAEQLRGEIAEFSRKLKGEGPSAELVGRMLDAALSIPPGDWLFAVDGRPVTIMWAHESSAASAVAAPPPIPPAQAAALAARDRGAWWAWLLPLLLLLALVALSWRACQPLPVSVVEIAGPPAAEPENPVPRQEERRRALQEDLEKRKRDEEAARLMCTPLPADPPVRRVEDLPPAPAAFPPSIVVVPPPSSRPAFPPIAPSPSLTTVSPPTAAVVPPPRTEPVPAPPVRRADAVPVPAPPVRPQPPTACRTSFPPGDEPEVIVVVDASGSMKEPVPGSQQSRMDAAKRAIEHVVRGLPDPITIGLIDFTSCTAIRRDRFYTSAERGALIGEVNALTPKQGTPLAGSIRRAGDIASSDAEATVVIVTDGDDTCGGDPCAEARAVKARKPNVKINIIDLSGDPKSRGVLQCVASATGGQVLIPNTAMDVPAMVQRATGQADVRQCRS